MTESKKKTKDERLIEDLDNDIRSLQEEIATLSNQIRQNEQFIEQQRRQLNQMLGKLQGLQEVRQKLTEK